MAESKIVVITGASSGIGEAVALELSKAGHTIVVGARRTERLQDLVSRIEASGGVARAHPLDVTSRGDLVRVVNATLDEFGRIDVMVNNAGVMPLSPLKALKVDEWDQMIDVNIKGVLNGIAAVLPAMEARGSGHIVNVASIGAHRVSPTAAVYCATKYAVWAISDGLRQETDRLRVTVISPGVVTSELAETISDETAREAMRDFRKNAIDPAAIGRAIRYAIEQPPEVDVSEIVVRPVASPH
ncbi:SDR family oxidoreductase [Microvirga pudoricolor]|uniref:SDR family oxidoreductase n=1 Tax=Microvirga pudoricolor TaxID=2778729 RepID=UPI00194EDE4D|nr:SDR family oxidoreductase [Microvirga pudoricolor]MBM6594228.1 SDR family oxidoreductase [Microvirga pudoricolor]